MFRTPQYFFFRAPEKRATVPLILLYRLYSPLSCVFFFVSPCTITPITPRSPPHFLPRTTIFPPKIKKPPFASKKPYSSCIIYYTKATHRNEHLKFHVKSTPVPPRKKPVPIAPIYIFSMVKLGDFLAV